MKRYTYLFSSFFLCWTKAIARSDWRETKFFIGQVNLIGKLLFMFSIRHIMNYSTKWEFGWCWIEVKFNFYRYRHFFSSFYIFFTPILFGRWLMARTCSIEVQLRKKKMSILLTKNELQNKINTFYVSLTCDYLLSSFILTKVSEKSAEMQRNVCTFSAL